LCVPVLLLFASCSTKQPTTRSELTGVYRAARSIDGALAVGVSYGDFSTLVREFSGELLVARDQIRFDPQANGAVLPVLDKYAEMLAMYKDSEQVWGFEIRQEKYNDALPVLAVKYGVAGAVYDRKDSTYGITSTSRNVNYESIRQAIWKKASDIHEHQLAAVYGQPIAVAFTKN